MNPGGWQTDWILGAMKICRAYGLEAIKAVLGRADTMVIEIHADCDFELARWIMRAIGCIAQDGRPVES